MALRRFISQIESSYSDLNVKLSGCAKLTSKNYVKYSASVIVEGEGPIPIPMVDHLEQAERQFRTVSLPSFDLCTVQLIEAISGQQSLVRWQIQYTMK